MDHHIDNPSFYVGEASDLIRSKLSDVLSGGATSPKTLAPSHGHPANVNVVVPTQRVALPLHCSPHPKVDIGSSNSSSEIVGIGTIGSPVVGSITEACIALRKENLRLKQQVCNLSFENLTLQKALLDFETEALSTSSALGDGLKNAQRLKVQRTTIERKSLLCL